jgi:hypothetical protein
MRARFGGVLFLWVLQIGLGLLAALVLAIPLIDVVVVAAMIGTYLSTYWTLAFRRMELGMSRGIARET